MTRLLKLLEGVYDPGILKAVFLGGGPGSGKSYIADTIFGTSRVDSALTTFSHYGLKIIDSDVEFTRLLRKSGIDPSALSSMKPKDFKKLTYGPGSLRDKAKLLTMKQKNFLEFGRLGLIIDGTGRNKDKIAKQKRYLESLGYDTAMIFINTKLDTALKRNKSRERKLPEKLVKQFWTDVQSNMGEFQNLFDTFVIIDNDKKSGSEELKIEKAPQIKKIEKFINSPVKNSIGQAWIKYELEKKKKS